MLYEKLWCQRIREKTRWAGLTDLDCTVRLDWSLTKYEGKRAATYYVIASHHHKTTETFVNIRGFLLKLLDSQTVFSNLVNTGIQFQEMLPSSAKTPSNNC